MNNKHTLSVKDMYSENEDGKRLPEPILTDPRITEIALTDDPMPAIPDETYDSTYLICPYCGYQNGDMFESGLEDGTESDYECGGCDKVFTALFEIHHSYTGKPKTFKYGTSKGRSRIIEDMIR
jgi:hypothetical protein